jgi:AraC-like DNA-binding protein
MKSPPSISGTKPNSNRSIKEFGLTENRFWTRQDGRMSVQWYRPTGHAEFLPHTHSEYSIAVCLEGEISLNQMGEFSMVKQGGAMVTNFGVEHSSAYIASKSGAREAVSLTFDRSFIESLAEEFNLPSTTEDKCAAFLGALEQGSVHEAAQRIRSEFVENRPGQAFAIEILGRQLLLEVLRSWPKARIEKIPADLTPRLPRKDFVRAYEFMRTCQKQDFRLQSLCQFLGSSEERFTRLFLSSTRSTPAVFYNRLLMERARELLKNEAFSVKEIAFQLGFKTPSHFISVFRKEFGCSPQKHQSFPDSSIRSSHDETKQN